MFIYRIIGQPKTLTKDFTFDDGSLGSVATVESRKNKIYLDGTMLRIRVDGLKIKKEKRIFN